jgi:hypothetical protein
MRTRTKLLTLVAAAAISASAGAALAHHSFAMFDASKTVTMTGEVSEFEWINPHVWLHIKSVDDNGADVEWSFEAGSTGQLGQTGWTRESVHPGDAIEVSFHPLKDGSNGGQLLEITTADGTNLCQGAECRDKLNATN